MPLANMHAEFVEPYFSVATPLVRKAFAKKTSLKFVPNFYFKLDSSFSDIEHLEELMQKNKIESDRLNLAENL
jgi:ribosome-binding factor A